MKKIMCLILTVTLLLAVFLPHAESLPDGWDFLVGTEHNLPSDLFNHADTRACIIWENRFYPEYSYGGTLALHIGSGTTYRDIAGGFLSIVYASPDTPDKRLALAWFSVDA